MMKNKWKSGYSKNIKNGFSSEYFVLFYGKEIFQLRKIVFFLKFSKEEKMDTSEYESG